MEQVVEVPWIFLSHSGEQKEFTQHLYLELVHAGHHPFFDRDPERSLPKGLDFPRRIVQACRGCKMGIVVLSHRYIESLWPMLELEQFAFHNPSILLYPLFYCLQPVDLAKEQSFRRWKLRWDSRASSWQDRVRALQVPDLDIDIAVWPEALQKLKYRNGDVFTPDIMTDHDYIRNIVSNICKMIPPPRRYSLGDHFKGLDRMQEDIHKLFQYAGSISNQACRAIGLYGIGGTGKTTLCKNMADFYNNDFPGRSLVLELPTQSNEAQFLQAMINKVLPALGHSCSEARISTTEEALSELEDGLRRYKVFIALDNVWDWAFEMVRHILSMQFFPGSKLIITSRSKNLLDKLLPTTVLHVPSITEEEAAKALLSYSGAANFAHTILEEDITMLAQSCFFKGRCHPLLLKAKGGKIRRIGGRIECAQDWRLFILSLQAHPIHDEEEMEAAVVTVLESSLLELPVKLQRVFFDLVTCTPTKGYLSLQDMSEWLSMLYRDSHNYSEDEMRYQLIELEYHGLLEIVSVENFLGFPNQYLDIHDLHKTLVARRIAHFAPDQTHCQYSGHVFEGHTSSLSKAECKKLKHIHTDMSYAEEDILRVLNLCSELRILVLSSSFPLRRLSVRQRMPSLRFLKLEKCKSLEEIDGWRWAPNLVSIELHECTHLQKLGDMGWLQQLEKLVIRSEETPEAVHVPDLTKCHKLQTLVFNSKSLTNLASLGNPSNLQKLDLSRNTNLVDVGTLGNFTALQWLSLKGCSELRNFPCINLKRLNTLDLSSCPKLQSMGNGSICELTALERLSLTSCYKLETIPDPRHVVRLRILEAGCCKSLKELKLDASSLTCLEILCLDWCRCLQVYIWYDGRLRSLAVDELMSYLVSTGADQQQAEKKNQNLHVTQCELQPMCVERAGGFTLQRQYPGSTGFMNRLLVLKVSDASCTSLDVSGLTSLETLGLANFISLQQIAGLTTLVNLKQLCINKCSCIKEITKLEALPKLKTLEVYECALLAQIRDLAAASNIEEFWVRDCPALTINLSDMIHIKRFSLRKCANIQADQGTVNLELTSLKSLIFVEDSSLDALDAFSKCSLPSLGYLMICSCASLQTLPNLHVTQLRELRVEKCSSLRDVSTLASLTSLRRLALRECDSLTELPDLAHLRRLCELEIRGCSSVQKAPKVCHSAEVLWEAGKRETILLWANNCLPSLITSCFSAD